MISTMQTIQDQALALLSPVFGKNENNNQDLTPQASNQDVIREKQDTVAPESTEKEGQSPFFIAGMAAMAVGGMALLSSAVTLTRVPGIAGRSIKDNGNYPVRMENLISHNLKF